MKQIIISIVSILTFILCNGCIKKAYNPIEPKSPAELDNFAWTSAGLTNTFVNAFAVSGTNLFAGGGGVFLSTNDGSSWTAVNNGLPAHTGVTCFAVNGMNLYMGTDGNGAFLSTNNGASWTTVNNGLTNTFVLSLAASPAGGSGTNIFAGTDGGLWGTTGGGVFLSTDNGTNWSAVNNGLTDTLVTALAVSSGGSGTNIFAGTKNSGVFLSTNNGSSWTAVNNGLTYTWGIKALTVSGMNLYAGTDYGIFLSANNGTSWNAMNAGLTNKYISSLAAFGGELFAGTNGGVFRSNDGGTYWNQYNTGLTDTLVSALAICDRFLYAGNFAQAEPALYRGPLLTSGVWRRCFEYARLVR
jgi:hypothetical protein